jgi:ankyrin repeat protein
MQEESHDEEENENKLKNQKIALYNRFLSSLIEHKADINLKTKDGIPPIFLALINHNIVATKQLLKSKDIDLSIVSKDGETIFHYLAELALHDDFMEIFNLIIKKLKHRKTLLNTVKKTGESGLHKLFDKLTLKYSNCLSEYQTEFTN